MPADTPTSSHGLKRSKQLAFRIVTVLFGLVIGFAAAELFLRIRNHRIQASGVYDPPNLFRYDATLGWALTPGWRGTHRHFDYQTHYSINKSGFREDAVPAMRPRGKLHAVVGDSFTFGLGVADAETFVRLLNEGATNSFLNFSIPGYSTDQEALLIEQEVLKIKPDVVCLVVYLGNDLFDNPLPFPIQASRGKPYAELSRTGLTFQNIPVPLVTKSVAESAITLATLVHGEDYNRQSVRGKLENASATFALLSERVFPPRQEQGSFEGRFEPQVLLFFAIIDRIRTSCASHGASLNLILMAGRSYIEFPKSISAEFQEYLRRQITSRAAEKGLIVTDLALALRMSYAQSPKEWFYPNDGHLNAAGHKVVAQLLARDLN